MTVLRRTVMIGAFLFLATLMVGASAQAKGFLHTRGQDMVDEGGNKVLLRGVGLGNWLLPEGYMWKFGQAGDRPRTIEKLVSDLIGPEKADEFWLAFRKNYITEADIARIAQLGFNSVRPALNARRFLTEGENPTYVDEGFELLDNLVGWCGKHGIYVIIDMHGAPGGQTGANIDDSPNDEPGLFMDPRNQDLLVNLWVKIAKRYKDEPTVAAYDLLNEPLPGRTGAAEKYKHELEPLYKRITEAIRRVDKRHMITVEGADWANDWSVFSEPFDDNLFYQFHYYCWDRPTNLKSIERFLARRAELNAPVWVGETGEKDNAIYWGTTQYFEAHNIGWSFWPWKKMDTSNTPYSINKPTEWDQIAAYSRGREKPSPEVAQRAFDELIENVKLENCVYYPDVVNAILRRIPGRIEAENYGHAGPGRSYSVKNASQKAKYYRTSEPVPVVPIEPGDTRLRAGQCIRLSEGEWTGYEVASIGYGQFRASIRVKADAIPSAFEISCDGLAREVPVAETGWTQIDLGDVELTEGDHKVTLTVTEGTMCFDWMQAQ